MRITTLPGRGSRARLEMWAETTSDHPYERESLTSYLSLPRCAILMRVTLLVVTELWPPRLK